MTKKELIEMIKDVPDDANIKIDRIRGTLFGSNIIYAPIKGFYKVSDTDYVLTHKYI